MIADKEGLVYLSKDAVKAKIVRWFSTDNMSDSISFKYSLSPDPYNNPHRKTNIHNKEMVADETGHLSFMTLAVATPHEDGTMDAFFPDYFLFKEFVTSDGSYVTLCLPLQYSDLTYCYNISKSSVFWNKLSDIGLGSVSDLLDRLDWDSVDDIGFDQIKKLYKTTGKSRYDVRDVRTTYEIEDPNTNKTFTFYIIVNHIGTYGFDLSSVINELQDKIDCYITIKDEISYDKLTPTGNNLLIISDIEKVNQKQTKKEPLN